MRRCIASACAALIVPIALTAQGARWSVDVGTSRTEYADSISATAFSVTPTFVDPSSRFWLNGSATLSQLAGAAWNAFAATAAANRQSAGPPSDDKDGFRRRWRVKD